jgi:hypothetical protein
VNPYEDAARTRKAFALAARLLKHNITADEAERMSLEQWRQLAKVAKVNSPSADTVAAAIEALRTMEPVKAD